MSLIMKYIQTYIHNAQQSNIMLWEQTVAKAVCEHVCVGGECYGYKMSSMTCWRALRGSIFRCLCSTKPDPWRRTSADLPRKMFQVKHRLVLFAVQQKIVVFGSRLHFCKKVLLNKAPCLDAGPVLRKSLLAREIILNEDAQNRTCLDNPFWSNGMTRDTKKRTRNKFRWKSRYSSKTLCTRARCTARAPLKILHISVFRHGRV